MIVADTSAEQPKPGFTMNRRLLLLSEDRPGAGWGQIHQKFWPGWRNWYENKGGSSAGTQDAQRAIRLHMPEFERLIDTLSEVAPDDSSLQSFLSFWCPPRYLTNCSQAASVDAFGPFLIRNYDLDPALNELTLLRSCWRGKRVIGMVDGLSGLSDGVNENGLAVSLSFGGRLKIGLGFGVPLIIRYLLETCTDVQDATEALRRIPCHMSYNLTLTDRSGKAVTAFLAPDRPAIVQNRRWSTNHQLGVELLGHGRFSATLERAEILSNLVTDANPTAAELTNVFLTGPVFVTNYEEGFGTVFTSLYRPEARTVELLFAGGTAGTWSVDDYPNTQIPLQFDKTGSRFQ